MHGIGFKGATATGLVLVLSAAAPLRAAPLSLSDCLRLARERAPAALTGRLGEEQARRSRDAAKLSLLPSVAALGGLTGTDNIAYAPILDNSENAAVNVRFAGFPWGQTWATSRELQAALSAAGFSRAEAEQDTDLAVKSLYFGALEQRDAVSSMDRVADTEKALLDAIAPRYTMGRAPPFDPVKVRGSLADLARNRGLAEADLAGKRDRLARLIGVPAESLEFAPLSAVPEVPADTVAWTSNPTLQALDAGVRATRESLEAARLLRYPDMVGDFQYGYTGPKISEVSAGYVASLGLRLPLFDWGTISSQIDAQKAVVGQAQERLAGAEQDVASEWVQARAEARTHREDLERLQSLLPDTRQAARSSIGRYKRGAASILEATEAIDLWLSTQLNERAAYYDYLTSLARLERLTGEAWSAGYEK